MHVNCKIKQIDFEKAETPSLSYFYFKCLPGNFTKQLI